LSIGGLTLMLLSICVIHALVPSARGRTPPPRNLAVSHERYVTEKRDQETFELDNFEPSAAETRASPGNARPVTDNGKP